MYCLRPQLKRVPAGEWLCPTCKQAKAALNKKPSASRGRRKSAIVSEEEEEEEEEEDEEEDDDAMEEDDDEEEEEEEEDDEEEAEDDDEEEDGDDTSAECGYCWKPGKIGVLQPMSLRLSHALHGSAVDRSAGGFRRMALPALSTGREEERRAWKETNERSPGG